MSVAVQFEKLRSAFRFPFQSLKGKQILVIEHVLKGEDCFAIFPTGYGKTVMYLLPALLKKQYSFIVSPLRALMADQVRNFAAMGVNAIAIGPDITAKEKRALEDGHYQIVLFSPEVLQQMDRWRFFLESSVYQDKVAVLAVDEVHLLQSWGEEFRPAFNRISELKSFFTNIPLLLLSATCTSDARAAILQKLQLPKDIHIEWEVPDRPNIHLSIESETGMDTSLLNWYLNKLKEQGTQTEKAVIYVSGIAQMSKLAVDIRGFLGDHAYTGRENTMIFQMFHSGMGRGDLEPILEGFSKPESAVRLLICTIAFGIGINIPDIRIILHWGCCKSIEDYWQELGRAGRDGLPAKAIMYATKHSLINVDQPIKDVVRESVKHEKCTRKLVLDILSVHEVFQVPVQDCDKECQAECACALCRCCTSCERKCSCHKKIVM